MNNLDPIGKSRIMRLSFVSFPLVYCCKHSFSVDLNSMGRYSNEDWLFVWVMITLLSSLNLKPRLFARLLKVLQ